VIVLAVGVAITILIPVIGWVIAPLLMLLVIGMGGKRTKVWRCGNCRSIMPRA
jgi:hypothetical protein